MIGAACAGMLERSLRPQEDPPPVGRAVRRLRRRLGRCRGRSSDFVLARILGGLGVGMASMLSPLYIAEVAPARIRGRLVSLNQITIISGMLVIAVVNWLIADAAPEEAWNVQVGWRWMFGSEALPAVALPVVPVHRAREPPLADQAGPPRRGDGHPYATRRRRAGPAEHGRDRGRHRATKAARCETSSSRASAWRL